MVNPLKFLKRKIKTWKRKCNWTAKTTRLSNYFTEYCNRTSIHGFRYIGEQARSRTERCGWFITIIILTFICCIYIVQAYLKWKQSPVIVSLESQQMHIWRIPFPAVTICPATKFKQSLFNFTDMFLNDFKDLNATQEDELQYASLICKFQDVGKFAKLNYVNESALDFFDKVTPKFKIFRNCSWNGRKMPCKELFTPILTDEGVCYTFNMISRDELFSDDIILYKSYQKHKHPSKETLTHNCTFDKLYPRRARLSGAKSGLEVTLVEQSEDLNYNCGNSLQGYKVLLHASDELPQVKRNFFHVPLNYVVNAAFTPNVMSTSEELKTYDPIERECYFKDKKIISYFKGYNQKNCQLSLLTELIYKECNCVAFYMPREIGTPICGPRKLACVKFVENKYLDEAVDAKISEALYEEEMEMDYTFWGTVFYMFSWFPQGEDRVPDRTQECLPSCTTTTYATEISQSRWDWKRKIVKNYNLQKTNPRSKLEIYFKDVQFTASKRNEIYGSRDFLASCGGLLGLFTGFSIVSLIEIVYFLTFRWMLK